MLRISLCLPACLPACVRYYYRKFICFSNYSLYSLDSKAEDDKIRAREMNQIEQSNNIIGLCNEFRYSKSRLVVIFGWFAQAQMSTDERRRKGVRWRGRI